MSLMQVLQQVTQLQRQVDDQARLLETFVRDNRQNMTFVQAELKGSSKGHDVKLMGSMRQAEDGLRKAERALANASVALLRVRAK
ncbi:MAG: hypothetical protein GX555_15485 [Actinomycetales bacterium]|nr:hypothetical protein [Actinomycetales bacterium]